MHASLVTNYHQQPRQQAQQLHHHNQNDHLHQQQQQQTQQHYYDHYQQTEAINVGFHDGACLGLGLQRPVAVENVVASEENDQEGESNGPGTSNEIPVSSLVASNQEAGQDLIEQQHHQRSQQEHIQTGEEVHFLNSHTTTGAVVYALGQEQPPQQHYRYGTATTTTASAAPVAPVVSYQMQEDEQQYYEHSNQPPDSGFVLNHDDHQSTSFHHEHQLQQQQQTEHMALSSNRQQAVDLTNPDQPQQSQSQGPFESSPAIYYDLTSVGVLGHNAPTTTNTTTISTTTLDYHEHQNPLNHHPQHPIDQQRLPSVVYQHPFQSYQPGSATTELIRQPTGFVSVLTEQNRFLRPIECSDGLNTANNVSCHQNQLDQYQSYEQSSSSRLSNDNTPRLEQSSSITPANTSPFPNSNRTQARQHESQLSLAPETNELDSPYSQSLNLIAIDYHHHHQQAQGACPPAEHHQANNENYHHSHNHEQQLVDHDHHHNHSHHHPHLHHHLEYHNDCGNVTDRIDKHQQQQAGDYEAHLIMGASSSSTSRPRDTHSCAPSTLSESSSMTTNSDLESVDSALTRDEKKAREANIPLSYHEIVNLSIDQFNDHISRSSYTEAQLTLMKDIRRRGKNKVAAQTCRKRKMEQITELQQEVGELVNKRMMLALERSRLSQEHAKLVKEYNRWCSLIQSHLQTDQPPLHGHLTNGDANCVGGGDRCELTNNAGLVQDKLGWSTQLAKSAGDEDEDRDEDEEAAQQQVPLC